MNDTPPSPPVSEHLFSEKERAFFAKQIQQVNAMQMAIQNAMALVIEQQSLEGQWRLKQDGSGIERVDLPNA
jgi:hypothetical protein